MNEYQQQAIDFLKSANATMEIKFRGCFPNDYWGDDKSRNNYNVTIATPRGTMSVVFWDSIRNTEMSNLTYQQYKEKYYVPKWRNTYAPESESSARKGFNEFKARYVPTEYNVLACLQKYDVGTMDDFFSDFCYEIKSAKDMTDFMTTYNAVCKEYTDLCRIFTPEQMEQLREIN